MMKCDELKVYHCNEWHNEYTEFYLKAEADKVIADLEESHKMEVEQLLLEIVELKEKHKTEVKELLCLIRDKENNFNRAFDSEEKELRHNKFKRCLAMARWCRSRACFYDTMREGSLYWAWKSDKAYKWHKRWQGIAEKFKDKVAK